MSNSDYLLRATVKKISEKLNKTFSEKIEEAANVAQEVPEILKKEIDYLKDEIIQEAQRLEKIDNDYQNDDLVNSQSSTEKSLHKISDINKRLESLNDLLDK